MGDRRPSKNYLKGRLFSWRLSVTTSELKTMYILYCNFYSNHTPFVKQCLSPKTLLLLLPER